MRKLQTLGFFVAWLWAALLSGQTPSVVISGGQQPEFSPGNINLLPPDYALDIECTGGPAKFKLTGEPNFSPSPKLRPDGWWECSGKLRVQFAASSQAVELVVAPATVAQDAQNGAPGERRLRLDFAPAASSSSSSVAFAEWRPMIIPAMALMVAGFALLVILQMNRVNARRDKTSREREKDWDERILDLERRLVQLQNHTQPLARPRGAEESSTKPATDTGANPATSAATPVSLVIASQVVTEERPSAPREDTLLHDVTLWRKRIQNRELDCPEELRTKLKQYQILLNRAASADANGEIASEMLSPLAVSIAMFVADFTDQNIDQQREDPEWQALLCHILEAAKTEDIHPRRNDEFDESKHSQVAVAPKQSPNDLSQHVALLRHRGYRAGGEVRRKAAVVLYQ